MSRHERGPTRGPAAVVMVVGDRGCANNRNEHHSIGTIVLRLISESMSRLRLGVGSLKKATFGRKLRI